MNEITLLAFAAVAFIGIATPGPTVLLALTNGSRYGIGRSSYGMLGAVLSDFVLIGAVAIGLGALLAASEFWFSVVKWVGVGYLVFLGVMLLRSQGSLDLSQEPSGRRDQSQGLPVLLGLPAAVHRAIRAAGRAVPGPGPGFRGDRLPGHAWLCGARFSGSPFAQALRRSLAGSHLRRRIADARRFARLLSPRRCQLIRCPQVSG